MKHLYYHHSLVIRSFLHRSFDCSSYVSLLYCRMRTTTDNYSNTLEVITITNNNTRTNLLDMLNYVEWCHSTIFMTVITASYGQNNKLHP
jgi:hypothetical protein